MEKTTPQGKLQAMNSTSDKAGDSSLDGIVDSSAASFKAKSVREGNDCKGMFFRMSFGNETLHPFPTFFKGDKVLHEFVLKRSSSSLAQHMPIKLISPIFIDSDSADDYIHGDQRDTIGPHLTAVKALDLKGYPWNLDEMNPHEAAKFLQAKLT